MLKSFIIEIEGKDCEAIWDEDEEDYVLVRVPKEITRDGLFKLASEIKDITNAAWAEI